MKVECRGPKKGYDSEAKNDYRVKVWGKILENDHNDDDGYYVCMPSNSGAEIAVMIRYGIPENKIIAIDESAALLAMAKWRKEYPKVRIYGSKISRAAERVKKDGLKIVAANLDMCNNISGELLSETDAFLSITKCENVSITITKARESTALNLMVKRYGNDYGKDARVGALVSLIPHLNSEEIYSLDVNYCESYIHHKTPTLWMVLSIFHKRYKVVYGNDLVNSIKMEKMYNDLAINAHDMAFYIRNNWIERTIKKTPSSYDKYKNKMSSIDELYKKYRSALCNARFSSLGIIENAMEESRVQGYPSAIHHEISCSLGLVINQSCMSLRANLNNI